MPEEEVSEHAREYVVMPPRELPHFVVVHAEFDLGFLKAVLNRATHVAEPYERLRSYTSRCTADNVGVSGVAPDCAPD